MRFELVKLSIEEERSILPLQIAGRAGLESGWTFGAFNDDGEVVGVAFYSPEKAFKNSVAFDYLYVKPEARNRGIAYRLVDYAEKTFKESGVCMIYAKIIADAPEIYSYFEFVRELGFLSLTIDYRFLFYYYQDLAETEFVEHLEKYYKLTDCAVNYSELSESQVRQYLDAVRSQNPYYSCNGEDNLFSRYYVVNGNVLGHIKFDEVAPKTMVLTDLQVLNVPEARLALPAMLGSLFDAFDSMMTDDTCFIMQIKGDSNYNGIKSLFGEAEIDSRVCEFIKTLA